MTANAAIASIESRSLAAKPPVQILTLEIAGFFEFKAGQYLEVIHPDGTVIPLSIASPPELLPALTLHYRSTPGLLEAERMDELIEQESLTVQGGSGDVFLHPEDDNPLLLIAGGTGISQALCLATAQSRRYPQTEVCLLACADSEADLYFTDLLPSVDSFQSHLIADPARDSSNLGMRWLASDGVAFARKAEQSGAPLRVVLAGSPAFVYAATDILTDAGVPKETLESDVYAWAPR